MKGSFEHTIKSSLESYEAPFNPADWADMNNRLDVAKGKGKSSSKIGKGLLIAASAVVAAGLIYYFSSSAEKIQPNENVNSPAVNTALPANVQQGTQTVVENKGQRVAANNTTVENSGKPEQSIANNTTADNKSTAPEKTNAPVVANNTVPQNTNENKQPVQTPVEQTPVAVQPALSAAFRSDINKVCEGMPVQFSAERSEVPCTYKWYFADGETSVEQNPKHIFKTPGTYSVRLKVTSVKEKKSDEQKNNIIVIDAPSADMAYTADDDNKLTVRFDGSTDKGALLNWDFGDKKTTAGENPEHTYAKFGSYKVVLTAKNSAGCTASVTKDIKVENIIKLFAPNSFSPDGNNLNDTWGFSTTDENCTIALTIYDMRGTVVYSTSDRTPWDGTSSKTGETVKLGEEFKWVAVIKDKFGNISKDQGNIIVIK